MRQLSLTLALALMIGSTAQAQQQQHYTATLTTPVAHRKDVVILGNIFRCEGTTCTVVSKPSGFVDSIGTCRKLAREVGTLTAYGSDLAPFNTDKLAECNKS